SWIEYCPPKAGVVGSNPAGCATYRKGPKVKTLGPFCFTATTLRQACFTSHEDYRGRMAAVDQMAGEHTSPKLSCPGRLFGRQPLPCSLSQPRPMWHKPPIQLHKDVAMNAFTSDFCNQGGAGRNSAHATVLPTAPAGCMRR